jgi:hypothetical protein
MEFVSGGIFPRFPQTHGLLPKILRHRGFVRLLVEHLGAEELSYKTRHTRIMLCSPDTRPTRNFFVNSDCYVSHDTKIVLHEARVNELQTSEVYYRDWYDFGLRI